MAKCFVTGIELPLSETFVLDIPVAYRILKDLRQRAEAIERLIEQLSPWDDVEVFDARKREMVDRKERRLVSPGVAKALASVSPENELFIPWPLWRERKKRTRNQESLLGESNQVNGPCSMDKENEGRPPGEGPEENSHGADA
ncbi:MAG: hypothetical protein JRJ29_20420 [Deltaproteobacteria bacterium]|nr:hypothetical protein [Deltaproteobacteria bacterium]